MTTRGTIQNYFVRLKDKKEWADLFSEHVIFTSFTSPIKKVVGRDNFVAATKRFYASILRAELKELLVDGSKACALTSYFLQSPTGQSFPCDVSEIFTVTDGKIESLAIYFDTAPFPK